jgi:tetratricopeptide (TPR) repeat protein
MAALRRSAARLGAGAAVGAMLACGFAERAPQPPAMDPRSAARWVERGDAARERYRETHEPEAARVAETAYRLARDHDPASADALAGLAWARGVEHAFEESLTLAQGALLFDSEHVEAHGVLADAALALGRRELAAEHVQAMLDLRPGQASYARAAHLLEAEGEGTRAVSLMRLAIAAGSPRAEGTAWCRAQLVRMLQAQGATEAAREELEVALALTPQHPDLRAVADALVPARRGAERRTAALEALSSSGSPGSR